MTVTVRPARDPGEIAAAQALRVRVFCDEQGVDRELELDGLDEEALHVIAVDDRGVVATCRLRFSGSSCKLERMAVDRRGRGLGVGARLLEGAEREATARGAVEVVLHAQQQARGFYERHGYGAEGEPFVEAEIGHVQMRKRLAEGG